MVDNRRTGQTEKSVQDGVQNVVVPSVSAQAFSRVPRAPGLRAVNLRVWLAHYAHVKKYGNIRKKGCRFCWKGVEGIMASPKEVADLDEGRVAKGGGVDQEGPTSPTRGDGPGRGEDPVLWT